MKIRYFLILLFLFLFSCNSNAITKKDTENIVINVYDGDTVELSNGEKLRYLGIDTPELHKKEGENWIDVKEPYAKEAHEFNKSLVLGKSIKIFFDKEKRDKYGRLLGYVFADNIFVNEAMIREGLAFPYFIGPNNNYESKLLTAFKEAYSSGKNLYSQKLSNKNNFDSYLGKTVWYDGIIRNVFFGEKRVEIITDHIIIESQKRPIKKFNPSIGDRIYAYGQLTRKKDRYLLKVKKQSHIFIAKN